MTGTAATEAAEFYDIYKMNVVSASRPTCRCGVRTRKTSSTRDTADKFRRDRQEDQGSTPKRGQPVLVGTVSIEKSELLSRIS